MFAANAQRLAGLSAVLLGWRPHEFWAATPDELATSLHELLPQTPLPNAEDIARLMEMYPDG